MAGHITIDTLISGSIQTTTLGGPPSYAGLIARNLGADVSLLTKYGEDLPEEYVAWLNRNQLKTAGDAVSETHPTTRFRIVQTPDGREIYLEARCEDLNVEISDGDAAIISPVAGEVNPALLPRLRGKFQTIYLDPQGFLRRFQPDGRCLLDERNLGELRYADIVKMDEEEAYVITGNREPLQALKYVAEKGVKVAIYTRGSEGVLLRCSEGVFHIPVVRVTETVDTTGVGDIFAGAYTVTYLQGEDAVWAGCVAVAASSAGLDRVGLSKIPSIEEVAEAAEETRRKTRKIGAA